METVSSVGRGLAIPQYMTPQYFFFDTYIGYFLQVLPVAIIVSILFWIIKYRNDDQTSVKTKLLNSVFVCYMTGLICLVLLIKVIGIVWYWILYHRESGMFIRFFVFDYNLRPDFYRHMDGQMIGNLLIFCPFGIMYPLTNEKITWKKTILAGFICIMAIEVVQPVFGRAFDVNDIIMNFIGMLFFATVFFVMRNVIKKIKK